MPKLPPYTEPSPPCVKVPFRVWMSTIPAVITGFAGAFIRAALAKLRDGPRVSVLVNTDFREGSVVSLHAGREVMRAGDPVILMDADVLYDRRLMGRLVDSALPNCLLLDREAMR